MNKGKVARLAGFVGALGLSTVLVTTAVQGTGAWFTDSENGNLYASSGRLDISAQGTTINFSGLNPGQDKSQTITFTNDNTSTTNADIWLVFDATSDAYGKFTGNKDATYGSYTGGGMGQYGHFKVQGAAGTFESYNLQLPSEAAATDPSGYTSSGTNTCTVNGNGHGGSNAQHVTGAGNDIAECGVPAAILLQRNVGITGTGTATITFGLTGKQEQESQANDPNVGFKIVATQPNIRPDATW